ncbi:MAG: O-antigen ligase family protein, partial [Planctomycetaceae bacterium]
MSLPKGKRDDAYPSAPDRVSGFFAGCGLALVTARHVLPAESAHLGDTLWIAALWLLLATAWTLTRLRCQVPGRRLDRGDLALILLAGGQVLAALLVHGNARAALNGAWEWIAVAVSVGLLRRWCAAEARWQQLLATLSLAGVLLSGLGVWQYTVTYPQLRAELEEFTRLESQSEGERLTPAQATRFRELRVELGRLATETDPNVRFAMRQRLVASTEPLACFALANTLAGVLLVSLLLLLDAVGTSLTARQPWKQIARLMTPALLVGFCLVLTKSRTAWVALLAGAAVWAIVSFGRALLSPRVWRFLGAGLLALAVLIAGALAVGALDRLVLLESSKSLRYRVEYWTGAWGVIRDHVLFGVGPGNFRQHYLRYKVPGSSEEIFDPHNLFLDVWASGGLISLAGLILAGGVACVRWRTCWGAAADNPQSTPTCLDSSGRRFILFSGAAGIALVWMKTGLIDVHWDGRLAALLLGWLAAVLLVPRTHFRGASQLAAGLALGVHLLGAGGIGMPVVATTLLLLWLGPAPIGAPGPAESSAADRRRTAFISIGFAALLVACLFSAVIPATVAGLCMNAAESVLAQRNDVATARRFLDQAIKADGRDPQPYVLRAQLEHDTARPSGDLTGATMESALAFLRG